MLNSLAVYGFLSTQSAPFIAAVAIDIDGTIIVQMLLFWFVLAFLHFTLFRPYLKAVDAREDGVAGSREEAAEMQTRAGRVIEEYEAKMRQARRDATDVRESLRNQGLQEQNDMVGEEIGRASCRERECGPVCAASLNDLLGGVRAIPA